MELALTDLQPIRDARLTGDLRSWRDVELPGLGRRAELYAWLPPGYDGGEDRYPVLYLHDGHNAFLPERSFAGATWEVDRAMSTLARDGIPAIVVAVPCHPTERGEEYTPYAHPTLGGGRATDYAAFLVDHLKPAVDRALRTRPGPEHTLVAGSSLGGLVSAYLWTSRPDVFGGAGLFSPAYYWPTESLGERCLRDVEESLRLGPPAGRVYLDVGGHEHPFDAHVEQLYVEDAERLLGALRRAGVPVRYVYDSQGQHVETAWADRFPAAAAWLLQGYAVTPPAPAQPAPAQPGTAQPGTGTGDGS